MKRKGKGKRKTRRAPAAQNRKKSAARSGGIAPPAETFRTQALSARDHQKVKLTPEESRELREYTVNYWRARRLDEGPDADAKAAALDRDWREEHGESILADASADTAASGTERLARLASAELATRVVPLVDWFLARLDREVRKPFPGTSTTAFELLERADALEEMVSEPQRLRLQAIREARPRRDIRDVVRDLRGWSEARKSEISLQARCYNPQRASTTGTQRAQVEFNRAAAARDTHIRKSKPRGDHAAVVRGMEIDGWYVPGEDMKQKKENIRQAIEKYHATEARAAAPRRRAPGGANVPRLRRAHGRAAAKARPHRGRRPVPPVVTPPQPPGTLPEA